MEKKPGIKPRKEMNNALKKYSETHHELQQFDHSKIKKDSFIIVIGKRRYGKSTWTEYVLNDMWKFFPSGAYCFTKTKHNYYWQQHIPEERIYDGFDEEIVQEILDEQKTTYNRILSGDYGEDEIPYKLLIFDDVISDQTLRYQELLNEIVFSGRHYFLFIVVCSQDCKGLPPSVRQNADLVAVTYQTQERAIETITKDFADIFEDKKTFAELLKEHTQEHQLVIIDQTEAHYNADEVFFVDRAPDPKETTLEYRVGDMEFWEESGCDWEKQKEKYRNKLEFEKRDFDKVAEKLAEEDLKREKWFKDEQERLYTSFPSMSTLQKRVEHREQIAKKHGWEQGHVQKTFERLSEKKDFFYREGKRGFEKLAW